MVSNGSKEASAIAACLTALRDERALDRDQADKNKQKCQVSGDNTKWSIKLLGEMNLLYLTHLIHTGS